MTDIISKSRKPATMPAEPVGKASRRGGDVSRCLLVVLVAAAFVTTLPLAAGAGSVSDAVDGNTCGLDLTWELNGTDLTIAGSGDMRNYDDSVDRAPWGTGITSVTFSPNPGETMTIGEGAFSGCAGLTSLTIPDSVTSIGRNAFENCSGLTSLTIPDSVTSIDRSAFENCSGLTSLTIGNDVETIGEKAFSHCEKLTAVDIPDSVTSIGDYAFSGCAGLTSLTIPDSVTSIGDWAFSGCLNLTDLTIGNSVESIGDNAFFYCYFLTSVTIPDSVKYIGEEAFEGCRLSTVYYDSSGLALHPDDGCWPEAGGIQFIDAGTGTSPTVRWIRVPESSPRPMFSSRTR